MIEKKGEGRKRCKNNGEVTEKVVFRGMKRTNEMVRAMKREEGDEKEGEKGYMSITPLYNNTSCP